MKFTIKKPSSAIALLLFLLPKVADAVRPFVTDDARIVDQGQITTEVWVDNSIETGGLSSALQGLIGTAPTQWFETSFASGIGFSDALSRDVVNPTLQLKTLLLPATNDAYPGVALSFGYVPGMGAGASRADGSATYALLLLTERLFDDRLFLHLNLGFTDAWTMQRGNQKRPFWGTGAEFALWQFEWRGVFEVFSGDPFDPLRSDFATQAGLRWLHSDLLNFDFIVGAQPDPLATRSHTGATETWVQLGIRITCDIFNRANTVGRSSGGDGLFRW